MKLNENADATRLMRIDDSSGQVAALFNVELDKLFKLVEFDDIEGDDHRPTSGLSPPSDNGGLRYQFRPLPIIVDDV